VINIPDTVGISRARNARRPGESAETCRNARISSCRCTATTTGMATANTLAGSSAGPGRPMHHQRAGRARGKTRRWKRWSWQSARSRPLPREHRRGYGSDLRRQQVRIWDHRPDSAV
jgi:hypothetical protein